jgi:hypothetical protein
MSYLERALLELETATAALAEIPIDSLGGAQAALKRRARAIEDLAELTSAPFSFPSEERESTLRRLRLACEAGVHMQQRLAAVERTAMAEWRQWSRIYRALDTSRGPDPSCDCRG